MITEWIINTPILVLASYRKFATAVTRLTVAKNDMHGVF